MSKGTYKRKARKPGHRRGRGSKMNTGLKRAQRASARRPLIHPDTALPPGKPSRQVLRRKALLEAKAARQAAERKRLEERR